MQLGWEGSTRVGDDDDEAGRRQRQRRRRTLDSVRVDESAGGRECEARRPVNSAGWGRGVGGRDCRRALVGRGGESAGPILAEAALRAQNLLISLYSPPVALIRLPRLVARLLSRCQPGSSISLGRRPAPAPESTARRREDRGAGSPIWDLTEAGGHMEIGRWSKVRGLRNRTKLMEVHEPEVGRLTAASDKQLARDQPTAPHMLSRRPDDRLFDWFHLSLWSTMYTKLASPPPKA